MRIPPSNDCGNSPPACFGLGADPDSRQCTPVSVCGRCPHVESCALLRIARFFERDVDEIAGVFLNSKFPHGRPTDRWRPRG